MWRFESQHIIHTPVPYPGAGRVQWLVAGDGRALVRLDRHGKFLWRTLLIEPEREEKSSRHSGDWLTAPTAVDLQSAGATEIIVQSTAGEVWNLTASGQVLWTWPGVGAADFIHYAVTGDLDGDGKAEILVPSDGGWLSCLDHRGRRPQCHAARAPER